MNRFNKPVTASHGRFEAARMNLVEALARHGVARVDLDSPVRMLRAYFGPRWPSLDVNDLTEEMLDEGTAFLERMVLEIRHRHVDRFTAIRKALMLVLLTVAVLSFVDAHLWPAKARATKQHHELISR